MKVRIIKGTNQIGGCITEITSNMGTRIIIDYGDNLDDEKQITVPGLTKKDNLKPSYDGVIITHSHKDHIGCASLVKKDIPIYLNKEGMKIHNNLCYFTKEYDKVLKEENNTIKFFEFDKSFFINDIKIKPFIADHSSYNSAMLLIEADGKKILHTGDYRNHGKKGCLFNKILKEIGKVDLLITEGTTLGSKKRVFIKENDLTKDFQKLIKYDQIYVICSSTNIDRIVNLYKTFAKTHLFIMDMCMNTTASLLKNIPNSNAFDNVYTFVSPNQRKIDNPYGKMIKQTKKVIYELPFNEKFIVSIKQSMGDYLKDNKKNIKNACLIYSMYDGYIKDNWKDPKLREFKNYLVNELHMDFFPIHTSGHASIEAIKTLAKMVNPRKVIIIHTEKNEEAKTLEREIFQDRLLDLKDGGIIDLNESSGEMKISNYNLNKLRRRYNNYEFFIRIRDKEVEGKETEDIIYYNGIKAFYMKIKNNNVITINLEENIYKLNRSNISNIIGEKKDATKIANLLTGLKEVRNTMKNYVRVHLSSIKLEIGSAYYKGKNYKQVQENAFEILKNINKELKKYNLEINCQEIKDKFAQKCWEKLNKYLINYPDLLQEIGNIDQDNVYEKINYLYKNKKELFKNIKFNVKVDTGLQINNTSIEEDLEIEKIFILNTIFKKDLIYDNKSGLCMPIFTFKMLDEEKLNLGNDLDKYDDSVKLAIQEYEQKDSDYLDNYADFIRLAIQEHENNIENELKKFDDSVKLAIQKYEKNTGEELEKKYQHLFMIENKLKNYTNLSKVVPFEEEYYTSEDNFQNDGSNNKKGRIDSIFVDTNEKQNDIYLIELKVNDAVIGRPNDSKEHGINMHLIDIDRLLNNKDKLNLNDFLQKLVNRYNYRIKILNNENEKTKNVTKENCNLNFWIICAIKGDSIADEKTQANRVLKKIKDLIDDDDIKSLGVTSLFKNSEPCYLKSTIDGRKITLKLLFNIWETKGNINKNKLLTIEELSNYCNEGEKNE